MDAGDEGFVNIAGTVSSKLLDALERICQYTRKEVGETDKEDPIKIFKLAEEDRDKSVALYIVSVPFLEEDIRFVKEEYGLPGDGILEHLF